jgi:hypothetical protein
MKQTLRLSSPLPRTSGRAQTHPASLLDVCAALFLTLAGLLGVEGYPDGE